jgi:hypothetical protein
MAHVTLENTNMALKKCAIVGRPASTAAMMKTECEPRDWPSPLMKGWSYGTRNEAVITASV